MKTFILVVLTLVIHATLSQNNPVVVELFTSQGCSSCPAADKNLSEILKTAQAQGKVVYGLSFHVDYWDNIGWKDPYSNPEFTERQRHYANLLHTEGVYTPQMIVNGQTEFVGANKAASFRALADAYSKKIAYQVILTSFHLENEKILFSYRLDKEPDDLEINIAIVEKKVENMVLRGENSGRMLSHNNVVRKFFSQYAKREATVEIQMPRGNADSELIVFLQDRRGYVLGATGKQVR